MPREMSNEKLHEEELRYFFHIDIAWVGYGKRTRCPCCGVCIGGDVKKPADWDQHPKYNQEPRSKHK